MNPPGSHADLVERFSSGVARICGIYGLPPLLGRLYGVLLLSPEPLSLESLAQAVGAAKSTVSVSVRKLEQLKMVRHHWMKGDRRDYYEAVVDPLAILTDWLRLFVLPELRVGRELSDLMDGALRNPSGADWPDAAGMDELRRRAALLRTYTDGALALLSKLLDARGDPNPQAFAAMLGLAPAAAADPAPTKTPRRRGAASPAEPAASPPPARGKPRNRSKKGRSV